VIEAASQHAVSVHQHEDTPELREEIAGAIQEERQPVGVAVPA
jgi:hypothetical protein